VLIACLLALGLAACLSATEITFAPAATTSTGWSACGDYAGYNCLTTANFDAQSLNTQNDGGLSSLFDTAFSTWNAMSAASGGGGNDWSLIDGGDLQGTFNVTTAAAQQFSDVELGGVTISVSTAGVTLPTLSDPTHQQLVWVQGLYVNYSPSSDSTITPYYAMDTCNLSNLNCGGPIAGGGTYFYAPAYPYQYGNNHFYDQPKALYEAPGTTQAFFDANAYLAVEDFANASAPTLTVYDGISYGFQDYISPEPGAWLLFGSGFIAILLVRRWRTSA
jgi:hypothetical protein